MAAFTITTDNNAPLSYTCCCAASYAAATRGLYRRAGRAREAGVSPSGSVSALGAGAATIFGLNLFMMQPGRAGKIMRIITVNVNGIRAAARKGFFSWMTRQRADIVCIQETKAQIEQLQDRVFWPRC